MEKFRKKPVMIEAIQLTNDRSVIVEILETIAGKFIDNISSEVDRVIIQGGININTLEGTMKANFNDYIIKGINGEFYPCKPDIFEKTYDVVKLAYTCTFGDALEAVKQGKRAARVGWNGKGMFIFMRPADELNVEFVVDKMKSLPQSVKDYYLQDIINEKGERVSVEENDNVKFTAYLCMKAADGSIVNGWLASQTDMLAEDWVILD